MQAWDSTEKFIDAVKLADHLLTLRHRGAVRMLAVVSDANFGANIDPAQRLIATLHRSGCAVLSSNSPNGLSGHTFRDTTTITVADPVEAISHIAHAATTALADA